MKILVTGSNGLLGQKLVYALREKKEVKLIATARGENRLFVKDGYEFISLDLTNEAEVISVINTVKPDAIIHTAAMTNVDACEKDPDGCNLQNVEVVKYLVEACKELKTHFIHLSTDFVFDGNDGPYRESDIPNPLSVYARAKLASEKIVEQSGLPYSILRTIIIYGVVDDTQRSNIVLWTKNSLEQQKDINVITDQLRSPTLAEDLADACIQAAMLKAQGIYHISGEEIFPIIEIAYRVADFFHLDKSHIHPITTAALNQPAARPLKTGFIIDKARKDLNYNPRTLEEGLEIVKQQLELKDS